MRSPLLLLLLVLFDQSHSRRSPSRPCGYSPTSLNLSTGTPVVERCCPWLVSLRHDQSHLCAGSIVSPWFVLTAAHCISYFSNGSSVTIVASTNDVDHRRSIWRMIEHPLYNSLTSENDLALLHLSVPFDLTNADLQPICLPSGKRSEATDEIDMIAVGWATSSTLEESPVPIRQQVLVRTMESTSQSCQKVIENLQLQFCASIIDGAKDVCQGDSGGPLMALNDGHWQLYGITSYGYDCALSGDAGVYTRISSFVPWINSIIDERYPLSTEITDTIVSQNFTSMQTTETTLSTALLFSASTGSRSSPVFVLLLLFCLIE